MVCEDLSLPGKWVFIADRKLLDVFGQTALGDVLRGWALGSTHKFGFPILSIYRKPTVTLSLSVR